MTGILQAEWIKLRRSKIWLLLVILPSLPILYTLFIYVGIMIGKYRFEADNLWFMPWAMSIMFYGGIFYPILSAMVATSLCRFEQTGNGWKQLFTFPVPRHQLFFGKLIWLYALLLFAQIFALALFVAVGKILGLDGPVPWGTLFISAMSGWVGALPLAAIQYSLALWMEGFVKPMISNVALTVPVFLIISSELKSSSVTLYPWALPAIGMMQGGTTGVSGMFLTVVPVVLFLAIFIGLTYFRRKSV
ncbi:ABC transporter permease [Staphylospora marina]|uniref:ABC transporter permease n=1 Tax=Staphylospora marina TaxID=2490858 RepID=UPI0013DE20A2|nr:ABC transporter permease [Staphylospora marina]